MLHIAALIINVDCFGFAESQKTKRWVQNDFEMCERLRVLSTYGKMEEDLDEFMGAKYSEKQFNLDFERLFYADAKLFKYKGEFINAAKEKVSKVFDVHYSVFFESMEKYLNHYGSDNFFQKVADIHAKK